MKPGVYRVTIDELIENEGVNPVTSGERSLSRKEAKEELSALVDVMLVKAQDHILEVSGQQWGSQSKLADFPVLEADEGAGPIEKIGEIMSICIAANACGVKGDAYAWTQAIYIVCCAALGAKLGQKALAKCTNMRNVRDALATMLYSTELDFGSIPLLKKRVERVDIACLTTDEQAPKPKNPFGRK